MIDADGTDNKGSIGANAMLAVSLAVATPLRTPAGCRSTSTSAAAVPVNCPVPMMNILNGGAHADNSVDFQEFMVMPVGFATFSEGLRAGVEIFHTLKKVLSKRGLATAVGDEGGFAPDLPVQPSRPRAHHGGHRHGGLRTRRTGRLWPWTRPLPSSLPMGHTTSPVRAARASPPRR